MTEKQLREAIRKEIRSQISEMDDKFSKGISGAARAGLGSAKAKMDAAMAQIEPEEIKGMLKPAKVDLIAGFLKKLGVTAKDFNTIKSPVGIELKESQKSNKQMLNEDAIAFLTQVGLPTIAKAIGFIADGNFDAAGNAFDTVMSRPQEAAALLGSIAGMVAGGGKLAQLGGKVVAFLKSKDESGEIDITGDEEKQINAMADKIPATEMQEAMNEIKSYYKQKALLEAKRRNTAKRKK